jgi:hypothetical protein
MMVPGMRFYWIAGVAISAAGVLLVRVVPGFLNGETPLVLRMAGYTVSVAGLLVILVGLRRNGERTR